MVNIGEISKPSVDRAQLKRAKTVDPTDPVEPTHEVSDLVELSEEARHRYEEELEKQQLAQKPPKASVQQGEDIDKKKGKIDLSV